MEDELYHVGRSKKDGAPVGSGRYPLGSGENPGQHPKDFKDRVTNMRKQGLSNKEIAERMGMTTKQLIDEYSLASGKVREAQIVRARELYSQGLGATAIARELGLPPSKESTVREWLKDSANKKHAIAEATSDILRKEVGEKKYVDIGKGVAESMGIPTTRLSAAVKALEDEGYSVYNINVPQASNPQQKTTIQVLAAPGIDSREVYLNRNDIGIIGSRFEDPNGTSVYGLKPIQSISSKRIQIAYAEDGGIEKDGVIELRRGVKGLDMGKSMYAQVRIGVDGTHYLKGMAIYSDDLPDGIDIRFNTNKAKGTPVGDVFKKMKDDPDNPFGSSIKKDERTGYFAQKGYLNIVNEEGDWSKWSKTLASQMLSKQPVALAQRQLDLAHAERKRELEEIQSLTNPTVRRYLLDQYADSCDTAAINLKAAAMPRQASHVILPVNSLKPNEVYAPNYKNGERVVLIRYPHGGIFEIPELRVNNNNPEAKRIFENPATGLKAPDAIGIHHSVAERLSGADFDGDTVLVIPNRRGVVKTGQPLPGLVGFDGKTQYPYYDGMKIISKKHMAKEMGIVSNLITDMTIKGASDEELARAVRYSMVVIDSYKHKLNYRQARDDNRITDLQKRYQQKENPTATGVEYGGASTLISRAKSQENVPERKQGRSGYRVDPETGKKIPVLTNRSYEKMRQLPDGSWVSTGKVISYETKSTKMAEADDARKLISKENYRIEQVYASYANQMKSLANQARKESYHTEPTPYSPEAHKKYKPEADEITRKVNEAKSKLPLERKAQAMASVTIKDKIEEATGLPYRAARKAMDTEERKKIEAQAIAGARAQLQSKKPTVTITDREWEAIQAGAVSKTTFNEALRYMDQDALKERAMPKTRKVMPPAKVGLAKAKLNAGYTQQEVADQLGISVSTLKRYVSAS